MNAGVKQASYSTRQQKQHVFILHAGQGHGQLPLQVLANQRS
jgi:hypothetical protein